MEAGREVCLSEKSLKNYQHFEADIRDAITGVLAKQTSSGGFGLWSPFDTTDLWMDSYVTEFLLRAKDAGYAIPELAQTMALDNLANQVSYAADFSNGGRLARGARSNS